ncbi:hypothetical protein [Methylobacterium sp. 10]|uniref:hypothetical protein n=1 Tax=Methylobacterium sp. 10 TaxID=1101191 RepID=UPI0004832A05|nr:hypothetical protein [Methylobacterium sp. 10]
MADDSVTTGKVEGIDPFSPGMERRYRSENKICLIEITTSDGTLIRMVLDRNQKMSITDGSAPYTFVIKEFVSMDEHFPEY